MSTIAKYQNMKKKFATTFYQMLLSIKFEVEEIEVWLKICDNDFLANNAVVRGGQRLSNICMGKRGPHGKFKISHAVNFRYSCSNRLGPTLNSQTIWYVKAYAQLKASLCSGEKILYKIHVISLWLSERDF